MDQYYRNEELAIQYYQCSAAQRKGPSQDWGCGGQLAIFAFVLWPRVDA